MLLWIITTLHQKLQKKKTTTRYTVKPVQGKLLVAKYKTKSVKIVSMVSTIHTYILVVLKLIAKQMN